MRLRRCRVAELAAVQEIDRAAGQMFAEVGRPEVCGLLWHPEALAACRAEGRLWVITGADDRPAGFVITGMVDGCVHVEQVSVDPGSARRGLGRALLEHAAEQAAAAGVPTLPGALLQARSPHAQASGQLRLPVADLHEAFRRFRARKCCVLDGAELRWF